MYKTLNYVHKLLINFKILCLSFKCLEHYSSLIYDLIKKK